MIDEARSIGYRRIFLDTLPSMTQAQAMYLGLGFEEVPRYRHNPVPGTVSLTVWFLVKGVDVPKWEAKAAAFQQQ